MNPVESAVGVVTNPLERAWNGVVNFDDVERENQALQDELDRLIGTQAAAEAAVLQAQEILALEQPARPCRASTPNWRRSSVVRPTTSTR